MLSEDKLEELKNLLREEPELYALLQQLHSLHDKLDLITREQWNRHLPLADYLSDRWEKAQRLGFGSGASVYDNCLIIGEVSVGENTWIGPNTLLDGSGGLSIGSNCSISAGVQIYSHDTVAWAVSGGEQPAERSPTSIGSNCYIGPNTIVAKGVSIGDGAVVGANSLVLSDVPAGKRAFGSPCKVQEEEAAG